MWVALLMRLHPSILQEPLYSKTSKNHREVRNPSQPQSRGKQT
jgi:hypothetical protein